MKFIIILLFVAVLALWAASLVVQPVPTIAVTAFVVGWGVLDNRSKRNADRLRRIERELRNQ